MDEVRSLIDIGAPIFIAQYQSWFLHGWDVSDLLDFIGLFSTKSDARRAIDNGALKINGRRVSALDEILDITDLRLWQNTPSLKITNGKKDVVIVCFRRDI